MLPTRRTALAAFLAAPALPLAGHGIAEAQYAPPRLELTPACGDSDERTVAEEEGPFFKPNAPPKHDLAADSPKGERITIAGFVLDARCQPVSKAIVQIWHADTKGQYDNSGYHLRGYQSTDESGRWWFSTIVPGLYPGRTRHYHVKVQRPFGSLLTTQLYFPAEPRNAEDSLFDKRLLLRIKDAADGRFGRFDFVV
ncbi:Protocatechuate 3,4-dioxygenase beta subunit [Rhizobiales bacterium GAS191]|nr:Protocatechuate 3,4-dioxygenase beta subunit [Rhizobiales bacterium GAS191]